jgi:Spy/CpxP family protein refolding chaperone
MRNRTGASIAIWLFAPMCLAAQQPAGPDPIMESLYPPELVMAHQKAIALDDVQKNDIRGELLKAQTRFTELQWQLQEAMESLVGLLKKNPADERQVLEQLDKVLAAERELKRTQIGLLVRIRNRLTPDQQAGLQKLRSEAK